MPLMHSEDLAVQKAALPLFERFSDPRTADFARRHSDVIAHFQRISHRNRALGRMERCEWLLKAEQEKTESRPLRSLVRIWRIDDGFVAPSVPPPRRAD